MFKYILLIYTYFNITNKYTNDYNEINYNIYTGSTLYEFKNINYDLMIYNYTYIK